MQRSACGAGVRPARTMQCHTKRLLAISLAIVLVICRSSSGFVIRDENWGATTDMEPEQSTLLEVWSDTKNHNNIKTAKNNFSKNETDFETVINNSTSSRNQSIAYPDIIVDKSATTVLVSLQNISFITTDGYSVLNLPDFLNTSTDSAAANETGFSTKPMNNETIITDPTLPSTKIDVETSTGSDYITITSSTFDQTASSVDVTMDTKSDTPTDFTITTTKEFPTVDTLNTETIKDDTSSTIWPQWKHYQTINRKRMTTTSSEETTTSVSEMWTAEGSQNVLDDLLSSTLTPSLDELLADFFNTQEYTTDTTTLIYENNTDLNIESGLEKQINKTTRNETKTQTATLALQLNLDTQTANSNIEMTKIETPVNLESQISEFVTPQTDMNTQTSTLEMLSINWGTETLEINTQTSEIETQTPKSDIQSEMSTSERPTILDTQTPKLDNMQVLKLDVISSKRAGYLDNIETTMEPAHGTVVTMIKKQDMNITDHLGSMYDIYGDFNEPANNNQTEAASKLTLTDDAINEEFLMEKLLSENIFLKKSERIPVLLETSSQARDESTTEQEDMLEIKPISSEKRNLSALYTVSPNYKPLKKFDVQHSKQFVRDPDDNSWRNESISSLGIVFKPKNASKSFTEVLKTKTTELSSIQKQGDKSDVPDLRVRLEKIAEVRKSKKKRINKLDGSMYGDYVESSDESSRNVSSREEIPANETSTPPSTTTTYTDISDNNIWSHKINIFSMAVDDSKTTNKLKYSNIGDYYDTMSTEDYDVDYATMMKIDLKKFTTPMTTIKEITTTQSPSAFITRSEQLTSTPVSTYPPNRQATVQYFPPTTKVAQKQYSKEYDDNFKDRLNLYTFKDTQNPPSSTTQDVVRPKHLDKIVNFRNPSPLPDTNYGSDYGTFNRASYVIKHYKDFIDEAAKYTEDDKEYVQLDKFVNSKSPGPSDLFDYDSQFRKTIVNRFVDNFNQNSERFKVDFPIIFNNSIVHRKEEDNGKVLASSNAVMKRLYETGNRSPSDYFMTTKPCGVNCDNINVDLSPAYELHYYVPEQEEKEEMMAELSTTRYR